MKVVENVTIYQCEHCGKKQYRKSDMSFHEKWCKKNPNNDHKCFQHCVHLIKGREEIDSEMEWPTTRCTFQCNVTKKFMFSAIAERRKIVPLLENVERMPLQCPFYIDRMVADYGLYDIEEIKAPQEAKTSMTEMRGKTWDKHDKQESF